MIVALLASAFLVHETAAQAVVQGIPGYKPIQDIMLVISFVNYLYNYIRHSMKYIYYFSIF